MKTLFLNIFVVLVLNFSLTACGPMGSYSWIEGDGILTFEKTSEQRSDGVTPESYEPGESLRAIIELDVDGLHISEGNYNSPRDSSMFMDSDFADLNIDTNPIELKSLRTAQLVRFSTDEMEWRAELEFLEIDDQTETQSFQESGCPRIEARLGVMIAKYKLTLTAVEDESLTIVQTGTATQRFIEPICDFTNAL
jgi:hypothetical protein